MVDTAFDRHAVGYDAIAQSALGTELRKRVHSVLEPLLTPQQHVVDLGCGSGLDAAWLGLRCSTVRAFDISSQMVDIAQDRCQEIDGVQVEQGDAATLALDTPAHVVLANFGVVNCVSDLVQFGERLAAMLTPGGHAVVVTMTRWCPIELVVAAATLNVDLLKRRFGDTNYYGTNVRYASAADLAHNFAPDLELVSAQAVGLALPPFEQRGWVENRPRLLREAARIDQIVATMGARAGVGDHHIAVFVKRS